MKHFSRFDFFKHAASTPLSNILLNSQLALSERDNTHNLKEILLSANYLKNLLNSEKNRESFTVNDALVEIILLNQCFHQDVSYTKKLKQSNDLTLSGNKLLFQEVINCLLNNAVEAYRSSNVNKIVLITTQIAKENLQIAITDGGTGMSWLEQQLLGRKFYSLKDDHQGVGIFYSKRIIKNKFSGTIKFISKKDQGSTAFIEIPLGYNLK